MTKDERKSWTDADILCPFFRALNRERITVTCEGWMRGSVAVTRFRNLTDWHRLIGEHCAGDYGHCPMSGMILDRKYPEERK